MAQHFVTGVDIGSQNVKAAIAEVKKEGQLALRKIIKMPSAGVRKGVVDDASDTTRAVSQLIGEIKKFDRNAVKNIFLSVGSSDVKIHSSKGIVAVSRADSEIQKDDIERAIEASQAIKLPRNRMVIHSMTKEFVVDDIGDIRDPAGMIGNRLEVNSIIIDAFEPNIKALTRCVETSGGSVAGLIFGPLAAARSVLSKSQKELGVALIDVGFGKTGFAVYEEGKLLHAAVFPFGSGNITNDLAIGLKTSIHAAENIKLALGLAIAKEAPSREMVDLKKFDVSSKRTVARRFIAQVIEDRLAEIFQFVDNELDRIGKSVKLPAGVVITGGGSKIPMIVDLAKDELKLSAQIGIADLSVFELSDPGFTEQAEDPEFTSVFGLLLWGGDRFETQEFGVGFGKEFFRKFFKNFIP